jgi:hypothetical protein
MSEVRTEFFFSYRSGKSRQVTKEEWEKEWLDWWNKTNFNNQDSEKIKLPPRQT